ncbi:hypothetical protein NPIL_240101, partial [Nephila pilipes]
RQAENRQVAPYPFLFRFSATARVNKGRGRWVPTNAPRSAPFTRSARIVREWVATVWQLLCHLGVVFS